MLNECIAHHMPDPANYKPLTDIDDKYKDLDTIVRNAIAGETDRNNRGQTTFNFK